jgi:hypothetical protein
MRARGESGERLQVESACKWREMEVKREENDEGER